MVGWHGIFERLGLPVSRVAGSVDGRTRAADGPRCGMCHRDAVWPARSSDEAGGALAGGVRAAPRVGGGPPRVPGGGARAIVALFGLREAAVRLAARWQGLSVRHRVWEAAFPLSAGVALLLGLFFPIPGSVYPRSLAWRYQNLLPRLGPIAFAGASVVLLFTWAIWGLLRFEIGRAPR